MAIGSAELDLSGLYTQPDPSTAGLDLTALRNGHIGIPKLLGLLQKAGHVFDVHPRNPTRPGFLTSVCDIENGHL